MALRYIRGDLHVASVSNKADKSIDQKVADAKLIAAAPELLAALKGLCLGTGI
jgi:hypothetical protein